MIEDPDGNIWMWTAYGISVITPDTILCYSKEDALTDNNVQDAFVDSGGRIHLATYFNPGITIFEDPYTYKKLPQQEIVRDIMEVSPGEIWYATQGSGILVRKGEIEYWLGVEEGLGDEIVLSMLRDSQGKIWCGTYREGLFIYENGSFHHLETEGISDPVAKELMEDSRGRIWIAGFDNGIYMLDDTYLKHLNTDNNLINNTVNTIYEDRFGSIWIATWGGVSKYGRAIF